MSFHELNLILNLKAHLVTTNVIMTLEGLSNVMRKYKNTQGY